ncbi:MAG: zinc ribbon domain-containing protein [Candidatus Aminicenantes bacterium]|nr:zinc ribbon domain-containing protein [Candidatus Aminicenantes bacterium]
MPLYEFTCQACGRRFEALVRISRENEVCCAACGGRDVRKLVSAFGIGGGASRLKSSGSGCATCSSSSCSTCK